MGSNLNRGLCFGKIIIDLLKLYVPLSLRLRAGKQNPFYKIPYPLNKAGDHVQIVSGLNYKRNRRFKC